MPSFLQLMAQRTVSDVKAQLIALCQANGLPVTSWPLGRPSERWLDITPRLVNAVLSGITTQAVRGFFLDLSTDPGDDGDLSTDQTPRGGFLSAFGEGWYYTTRRGRTFATTTVTLQNTGTGSSLAFLAFDLTFTTTDAAKPGGGRPTFRNETGSIIIPPGASVTFSVTAEQIGSYGNVSTNSLTLVTHSFDGAGVLTVTASGLAIGSDREDAGLYRARCRFAAAKLSPGGPGAAYRYAANTAIDGTPLQRYDGSGAVGITKTYASPDSSTGQVLAYFADDDGAADTIDVNSANANIEGVVLGVIANPIGVVPDTVTYIGAAATEVTVNIVGTAKIKSRKGVSDSALKTLAENAFNNAPTDTNYGGAALYFRVLDIGGRDQVAGAGVVPTSDLVGAVYSCKFLASDMVPAGLHAVVITTPGGASTAIALGHVAKLGTCALAVTVVS